MYQFKDARRRTIYVGKAKSLRPRVRSYFADSVSLHPRTAQMVSEAVDIEWTEVRTETEALLLEHSLIQQHTPRFNVRLKDDRSYPVIALTDGKWPRASVEHRTPTRKAKRFGPYPHSKTAHSLLGTLVKSFPVRTCNDTKFAAHSKQKSPCLLHHIGQCSAPCADLISPQEYASLLKGISSVLSGDTQEVVEELTGKMAAAADSHEFELAARLRDRISDVTRATEEQRIIGASQEDYDVIGVHDDELSASIQVFFIRKGRVTGQRGFIVDKVESLSHAQLVSKAMSQLYCGDYDAKWPKSVVVSHLPDDLSAHEKWLADGRGSKVAVRVPARGPKRSLLDTVCHNAKESLMRHKLKRASDYDSRARALRDIADYLSLPAPPLRIECYDMSHLQGEHYVGSMVVFEDGLPNKKEYRRFKLKGVTDNDDCAAMDEVLRRRLGNYLRESDSTSPSDPKFSYPPQLLVVDGGRQQLSVAARAVEDLGLSDRIHVCAIAKQFEEVFTPGNVDPLSIPRDSEALYLLQRLRDESHRFALSYHRKLRSKSLRAGPLDGIPGLGPKRKARLIRELGSTKAVRSTSLEDLLSISWLPDSVARQVHSQAGPGQKAELS